ncbi:imidazolonepropionase [Streptomyces peucetius]|uniref:Imidazolonepropionase n=1 Tax=Streptomyces peucetius TaxID=1950 RepID=A0ABY6I9S6_STRPE|nr:imidazolonepropionase [Streptomyces peucetius]UYQ62500.1 imidazolonepropionase [Streptomyces peucetius]
MNSGHETTNNAPATTNNAPATTNSAVAATATVITNIASLVTNDPSLGDGTPLGLIQDAAVVIDGDRIAWVGEKSKAPATDNRLDAGGRAVIPGFVDSHSHLVFAGDRTAEFNARMSGQPYAAGGIRTTVAATRAATDAQLDANVARYLAEALRQGTTVMETKSGYGLTVEDEARALRIAARHTDEVTFLGAHIVSPDHADDPATYVALVTGDMLDACAPYARWVDVFCEKGAFDGDQARAILTAGRSRGLLPRVHANQLTHGPGVQLAVELDAASADHCTHLTDADVDALANSATVATLLPGAEFSTRAEWPDARRLIDAGATVALSTDCNPGSSFTSSVPFCIALAVRDMGMTPDEALWSATAGGAAALRRTDVGRLTPGARADLVLLDAPSHVHLAYRPGVPLVSQVWRSGRRTV